MLRLIRRNTENNDCIGFNCLGKKAKFPTKSFQNTSIRSKEPGAFRFDSVSDFEFSWTPSSSLTPLSGSGSSSKSFDDDKKLAIPNFHRNFDLCDNSSSPATSSLTSLSGVSKSRFNVGMKLTTPNYDKDSESADRYSARESSSLTPLSDVCRSTSNGEFKVIFPLGQTRQTKSRDFERTKLQFRKGRDTSDTGRLKLKRDPIRLEVVSRGRRLMRTIQFPTVFIEMRKKTLYDSMVYYVILRSEGGLYVGDIAGVLYASPYRSKNVQKAELLPLYTVRSRKHSGAFKLAPMLLCERYRCLFEEGCTLKVKAIECGRRLDLRKRLWKNYKMKKWEIHDLLSRLLYLDISLIPAHLLKWMTPLRVAEKLQGTRRRQRKSYGSLLQKKNSRIVPIQKELYLQPDFSHRGLNTAVRSNSTDWCKVVPPQMKKNFLDQFQAKKIKNTGNNRRKLSKYLHVSYNI